MKQAREIELKLEVDPSAVDLIRAGIDIGKPKRLSATYFDTPEAELHARGVSFRIRSSGDAFVQTIKVGSGHGAGLFDRAEWERAVDDVFPDVAGARDVLDGIISIERLQAELQPVFSVEVERAEGQAVRDGSEIEIVLDVGEVVAGNSRSRICELELELKSGRPAALFDLAREVKGVAPVRIGVLTKADRGFGLLDGSTTKPTKAQPLPLTRGTSTADAFAVIAHACIRHFRLNEPLVVSQRSVGALHQCRVALRRLRSALSLFRDVVADDRTNPIKDELRWLSGTFGEARNLDVLLERLSESADDEAAINRVRFEREAAYQDVIDNLASDRVGGLMIDLVEWVEIGAWRSSANGQAAQPVEDFAADTLARFCRRVKKRGRDLSQQAAEERHQVRIEAKKLRYASEFFAALFDDKKQRRRHKSFLSALEDLQSSLGALNDIATGEEIVQSLALRGIHLPRSDHMASTESKRVADLLHAAEDAYDRLVDVKPFWR